MMIKKTWQEFMDSGLLWWINTILHTFGWAIVYSCNSDGTIKDVYPARVKFRGFHEAKNEEGYQKISKYMAENADELLKETQS